MEWIAYLQKHGGSTEELGMVDADNIDAAIKGARQLAGPFGLYDCVGVVPHGQAVPQLEERAKTLTTGRKTGWQGGKGRQRSAWLRARVADQEEC